MHAVHRLHAEETSRANFFYASLRSTHASARHQTVLANVQSRVASRIEFLQTGIFQIQSQRRWSENMRNENRGNLRPLRLMLLISSHDCAGVQPMPEMKWRLSNERTPSSRPVSLTGLDGSQTRCPPADAVSSNRSEGCHATLC